MACLRDQKGSDDRPDWLNSTQPTLYTQKTKAYFTSFYHVGMSENGVYPQL